MIKRAFYAGKQLAKNYGASDKTNILDVRVLDRAGEGFFLMDVFILTRTSRIKNDLAAKKRKIRKN
jgi:hypothetical protein